MITKIVLLVLLVSYTVTWVSGIYNAKIKKENKKTKLHIVLSLIT